jgi:hypothetical protein
MAPPRCAPCSAGMRDGDRRIAVPQDLDIAILGVERLLEVVEVLDLECRIDSSSGRPVPARPWTEPSARLPPPPRESKQDNGGPDYERSPSGGPHLYEGDRRGRNDTNCMCRRALRKIVNAWSKAWCVAAVVLPRPKFATSCAKFFLRKAEGSVVGVGLAGLALYGVKNAARTR